MVDITYVATMGYIRIVIRPVRLWWGLLYMWDVHISWAHQSVKLETNHPLGVQLPPHIPFMGNCNDKLYSLEQEVCITGIMSHISK